MKIELAEKRKDFFQLKKVKNYKYMAAKTKK